MIDRGKDSLAKVMRKQGLPLQRLMSHESLTGVAEELRLGGIDGLYAAIGEGHVSAQHVVSRGSWRTSAGRRAPARTSPRPPSR